MEDLTKIVACRHYSDGRVPSHVPRCLCVVCDPGTARPCGCFSCEPPTNRLDSLKERGRVIALATATSLLHEAQRVFEDRPTAESQSLCDQAMWVFRDARELPNLLSHTSVVATVEWFVRNINEAMEQLALKIAEFRDGGAK